MKKINFLPLLFALFAANCYQAGAQVISITKPIYTYFQNFDSLASSGTSSKLPYGWYLYEAGSSANTTYTADSGASSSGDTYSYGHAGSTDRALGSLATGSEQSYIGAQFANKTGYSINSIKVSYTIEQWRLGATGRQDSMPASVTTLATSLKLGFWIGLPVLSLKSPVTSGSTGQLDGNATANRKKVSFSISGISVANGSSIWLRWQDQNITGANDGLAIDDFSLSVKAYIPHSIRSSKFPQTNGVPDTTQTGLWKGIVLGQNYVNGGLYFQFKDSTGNITAISKSKTFGYTPSAGDSVAVYGQISSAHYLTYINIDSVGLINTGFSTGSPKTVTSINNDTLESGLVKIKTVRLATASVWDTTGAYKNGGFMTTMTDGANIYNVWVDKNSDLYGSLAPKFPYSLIGIVLQNGTTATTGYYIWPRSKADIDTTPLPVYTIAQVRPQDATTGIADSANTGHLIYLKGMVQSPGLLKTGQLFSLVDNTGAIMVASATVNNYVPKIGDSVLVRGIITQAAGLTEMAADSIRTLPKGITVLPAPIAIVNMNEAVEANLVKFRKAYIVDSTKWLPSGTDFTVKYTDGTDTIDVRIFNNTDLFALTSPPKGKFNITGIAGQLKATSPYIGGYQLYPRGLTDFEKILPFAPVPLYKIAQLKGYNASTGIADSLNKGKGFIKGVVHSQSFSASSLQFSLIDNSGAITIFSSNLTYYTPSIGDSLLISGTVQQTNGLTQYVPDSIITLTKGTWLQAPSVVTTLDESHESGIIRLNNVWLADTTQWNPIGTGFTVTITNGKDNFLMQINKTTDLFIMRPYIGHFNVTGIETQGKTNAPYFGNYLIEPRGLSDFQHVPQLYKIRDIRVQNALTGIADSTGSKNSFYLKGIATSQTFESSALSFSMMDSTGAIFIHDNISNYTPKIGDSIFVRGVLTQNNGLTTVESDSVVSLGKPAATPIPEIVTALNEQTEAKLVRLENLRVVDPTKWQWIGSVQQGITVPVTNGQDTFYLYMTNVDGTYLQSPPKGRFNVTGIGSQNQTGAPYTGGYFIMARIPSDITVIPGKLYKIRDIKPYNASTGVADSINTYCYLKGAVLCQDLVSLGTLFSIKDSTGAIIVTSQSPQLDSYIPQAGDSVEIRGLVAQNDGLTSFVIDTVHQLYSGPPVTLPVITVKLAESDESNLITINNLTLKDTVKWAAFPPRRFPISFETHDSLGDSVEILIMPNTDTYAKGEWLPGTYNITGIVGQDDAALPYFSGYYMMPRSLSDFSHNSGIPNQNYNTNTINVFPNPATNQLYIVSGQKMDRISVADMAGKTLFDKVPAGYDTQFDMGSLPAGIYLVKVLSCNQVAFKKVVKE